jgi:hypothetical protein
MGGWYEVCMLKIFELYLAMVLWLSAMGKIVYSHTHLVASAVEVVLLKRHGSGVMAFRQVLNLFGGFWREDLQRALSLQRGRRMQLLTCLLFNARMCA